MNRTWDEDADVIVVGFGYAGAVTAIEAHDAGARVLMIEKMPDPGGISVCSAGGLRIASNAEDAFAYLQATNAGTTPDPPLRALARGMTELPAYVERLADATGTGAVVGVRAAEANYPFPGYRSFGFVTIDDLPGFEPAREFPHVRGSPAGMRLFKLVKDAVAKRGIRTWLGTPARRLLTTQSDDDGAREVRGLLVERDGRGVRIAARRAVVLACGGFEGDLEMQRQFWQVKPVFSVAFRGNTGDGIRMAQDAGAALWHMWHFHGSYGLRHPDPAYPFAIRMKRLPDWLPGRGPAAEVRMAWILVDANGRRFMNEYDPYMQDTGHRGLEPYDPLAQRYARVPAWLIVDDAGRRLYPLGAPTYNDRAARMDWSKDNLAEVRQGVLSRAGDLDELAGRIGAPAAALKDTILRWNAAVASGAPDEFGRPPSSRVPISSPPFVVAPVWPVVSNTQGGPVHDEAQRVQDAFGRPIARLYAAGELGSVFGHLYMSGGNLAECFVGGRIAGRGAASWPAWHEEIDAR